MSKGWHYETLSQSLGTSGLKRMVMIISTAKLMFVVVLAGHEFIKNPEIF